MATSEFSGILVQLSPKIADNKPPITPNTTENNPNTAPKISLKKTTNKIIAKTIIISKILMVNFCVFC